jgi:hypothetical protein
MRGVTAMRSSTSSFETRHGVTHDMYTQWHRLRSTDLFFVSVFYQDEKTRREPDNFLVLLVAGAALARRCH